MQISHHHYRKIPLFNISESMHDNEIVNLPSYQKNIDIMKLSKILTHFVHDIISFQINVHFLGR